MNAKQLLTALAKAGKRAHLMGDLDAGVVARASTWKAAGSRCSTAKFSTASTLRPSRARARENDNLIPGGDGLYPAPEGTSLGITNTLQASGVLAPGLCAGAVSGDPSHAADRLHPR